MDDPHVERHFELSCATWCLLAEFGLFSPLARPVEHCSVHKYFLVYASKICKALTLVREDDNGKRVVYELNSTIHFLVRRDRMGSQQQRTDASEFIREDFRPHEFTTEFPNQGVILLVLQ